MCIVCVLFDLLTGLVVRWYMVHGTWYGLVLLLPMHVYAYVHACMRTCVHACIHACMHACIRACVHTCTHAYTCIHMHACIDPQVLFLLIT